MSKFLKFTIHFLLLTLCAMESYAQQGKMVFTGQVLDSLTEEPLPYVSVLAISVSSKKIISGTTAFNDGTFKLVSDSSNVVVQFSFMGYKNMTIKNFINQNGQVNLGTVKLSQSSQTLKEVSVTAEKSSVEFKLDKRVFNVGKDIASTGMGALDVLNNVPSVNVDIEGQVTLRGNAGVQILINGKPSVLADEQTNALGTITADMIESIEVITNPSAKYEAEGTSGIINIILKKEDKKGFNGSLSINTGIPNNHSIGGTVNYRTEKFNFFTQFGVGYRTQPRYNESINQDLINNTQVSSVGTDYRNENFYNITLGTDYYINELNIITLSGNYAYEIETQPSTTDFSIYDSTGSLFSKYQRTETTDATNPKWQYDLQYKKQFENDEDHVLLFSTLGSFFGKDLESDFKNEFTYGSETLANQQTATDFYQANYTFKLDYTNPISKFFTLEAGSQYDINDVGNDYAVYNLVNNDWIIDSSLTNNFEYNQKVLGFYATGAYEGDKWGLKLGLRAEATDLKTLLTTTNQANTQKYTNLFPSVHTSLKVTKQFSLQAGFTKRVFRPRLWDLNPFFNVRNNFNIRKGNPSLQPEFTDSYELTGIYVMNKASLNGSIYHLYTTNVIERVSFLDDGVNVTMPINVGVNNKTGFEINGKYSPIKWFTITGDFNYGFFFRKGSYKEQSFDFNGNQWSLKFTSKFKFPHDIDLEITPNYQSGYKTVQGFVSGFAFADLGIRKKIWQGKAIINLGIRDIFASRIRESIVDQPQFYLYSFSQRGRFFTLGFSYSFGKGEAMTYTGRRR